MRSRVRPERGAAVRVRAPALAMVAVTLGSAAAHAWLINRRGLQLLSADAVDEAFPVITVAMVLCAVTGATILDRYPGHPVGRLLVAQAGAGVGLVAGQIGTVLGPDNPVGAVGAVVGKLLGAPWALACLALLFLLVPDGRLPSRRWRPVARLIVAGYVTNLVAVLLIGPQRLAAGSGPVPPWLDVLYEAARITVTGSLVLALAGLVVRTRRASGTPRRQLVWVLTGATALAVGTLTFVVQATIGSATGTGRLLAELAFHAGYLAVPACTGVAVLRHHLYDVDQVVSRAVRLLALTALVTAGYVAVVTVTTTALAELLPRPWRGIGPSLVAFVVVAMSLQPARRRLQGAADRLVYGPQAAPYQALSALAGRLARGGPAHDLTDRIAAAVAQMCAAPATVALVLRSGAWGALATAGGRPAADGAQPWVASISHRGDTVGRVEVSPPTGRLTRRQRRLLADLVAAAGPAFHNARLEADLAAQAAAEIADTAVLAASRRRLVRAIYTERDRISAAIRRDVITHLDPVQEGLDAVAALLPERADEAASRLDGLRREIEAAIEALRTLTRGLYPAVLNRGEVTAAIRAAALAGGGVDLRTTGPVNDLPRGLVATVYFSVTECLRDLTGDRRTASLAVDGDLLTIDISGQARPQTTAAGVLDRVEAAGGTVEQTEAAGHRRLLIRLPVTGADPAQLRAQDSRGGPAEPGAIASRS